MFIIFLICILFHSFLVFTGSGDSTVKVFESKSGTCKRTYTGHTYAVNCFVVSLNKFFFKCKLKTKYLSKHICSSTFKNLRHFSSNFTITILLGFFRYSHTTKVFFFISTPFPPPPQKNTLDHPWGG